MKLKNVRTMVAYIRKFVQILLLVLISCNSNYNNVVKETETHIKINHENYSIIVEKEGFKYSFQDPMVW